MLISMRTHEPFEYLSVLWILSPVLLWNHYNSLKFIACRHSTQFTRIVNTVINIYNNVMNLNEIKMKKKNGYPVCQILHMIIVL